jgi:hypothetical protein
MDEEDSDNEEEISYSSSSSSSEWVSRNPGLFQLILLGFVLMVLMFYIKVCFFNPNNMTPVRCKEVEEFMNRTAQAFIQQPGVDINEL